MLLVSRCTISVLVLSIVVEMAVRISSSNYKFSERNVTGTPTGARRRVTRGVPLDTYRKICAPPCWFILKTQFWLERILVSEISYFDHTYATGLSVHCWTGSWTHYTHHHNTSFSVRRPTTPVKVLLLLKSSIHTLYRSVLAEWQVAQSANQLANMTLYDLSFGLKVLQTAPHSVTWRCTES